VIKVELTKEDMELFDSIMRDGNECDFIETFLEIVDKNLQLVPFMLTPEQKEFIQSLEKFNIVLKSRQLGLSVATIALAIRQCVIHDNSCCLLVSHDQKSCNAIFDKLKQQFRSLPNWLKPEEIANNRQEIKLVNGSKITCVVAGNKDLARGDTLHLVHCSEFAFWKSPKKQLNSIMQALAPDGIIIIESTANGQNYFAETFFKAKRDENSFRDFFFNWINGRTLFEKDYENAVEQWLARNNNKMLTTEDLDEDELELVKLGADIKQLIWRRLKISNSSLEEFRQEFPSTPTEAFQTTGSQIFANKRIDEVYNSISSKKEKFIPKSKMIELGLPSSLQNYYGKSLFIYHTPEKGKRYFIGVDCSEGIGKDYSTIEVYDKEGKECCMFRNNTIKPWEFADLIYDLGHYFNKSILGVERASGGHSVIEKLWYGKRYYNMMGHQDYDERNKAIWSPGFDTNSKTKGLIINNYRELFETKKIQINSLETLDEMKVFELKENGVSMGACIGMTDDLVMATAIALDLLKEGIQYKY
jgi:hypothetical protein